MVKARERLRNPALHIQQYVKSTIFYCKPNIPLLIELNIGGNNSLVNELKNIIIESDSLGLDFGKRIV